MSNKSGDVPTLNLPPFPQDEEGIPPALGEYFSLMILGLSEYTSLLNTKIAEMESLSLNGQGLNLTFWPANANIEKRDGVIVNFDGDPNVGTPGAGTQGLWMWNSNTATWTKV